MKAVTALQTQQQPYSRETLITQANTHGVVMTGPSSEDCWRSEVWDLVCLHRTIVGEDIMSLSILRLWLRWQLAKADGWSIPKSMRYSGNADEMILDTLNSDDSGLAVYQLHRPLR
jgi:hypothetical protein